MNRIPAAPTSSSHVVTRVALVALFLSVLAFAGTAFGSAPSSDDALPPGVRVLPVEPLFDGPVGVELSPTMATISITTLEDLACVVVYGTTDAFGSIALDADMGGGAHRDHLVTLRGLEPDTEYLFRFQGSAPDGTLYVSETMTFRTPSAPDDDARLGRNVARADAGARVTAASSVFGGGPLDGRWGATSAIDGDASTEWSSAGDGDDAFLTVELPERRAITGVGLWTRTMGSSAEIHEFVVETDEGERLGPFRLEDASGLHVFPVAAAGRTFTFRVTESSGGNTGAVEVAVFAAEE